MNSSNKFEQQVRAALRSIRGTKPLLTARLCKDSVEVALRSVDSIQNATPDLARALHAPQIIPGLVDLSYQQFARVACALAGLDLDDLIVRASQAGVAQAASPEVVAEKKPSPPKADPLAVQALMTLPGREVSKEVAEQIAASWPSGLDFNAYMQMALDRHTSTVVKD